MLINDILLENENMNTIVVYPGRFCPPHKGHMKLWNWLNDNFSNVYIATSNKVSHPKNPFSFDEKKKLLSFAGVDPEKIILTNEPYRPTEITKKFNSDSTSLVFAVSKKDMTTNPRFEFKTKKDGSPSYFQPYKKGKMEPLDKHAYVITAPVFKFNALDRNMSSATEIRNMFKKSGNQQKAKMIKDLYGRYSEDIHALLDNKLI